MTIAADFDFVTCPKCPMPAPESGRGGRTLSTVSNVPPAAVTPSEALPVAPALAPRPLPVAGILAGGTAFVAAVIFLAFLMLPVIGLGSAVIAGLTVLVATGMFAFAAERYMAGATSVVNVALAGFVFVADAFTAIIVTLLAG